jgi:hypothetical protein
LALSYGVAELDDTQSADDLVGYADLELLAGKRAMSVESA